MPGRTCAPAGETDEQLARRLQAEYDAQPAASPARPAAAAPAQQASPAGPLESGAAVCPIFPACFFFFFFFFKRPASSLCRTRHVRPKAPQWPLLCGTPGVGSARRCVCGAAPERARPCRSLQTVLCNMQRECTLAQAPAAPQAPSAHAKTSLASGRPRCAQVHYPTVNHASAGAPVRPSAPMAATDGTGNLSFPAGGAAMASAPPGPSGSAAGARANAGPSSGPQGPPMSPPSQVRTPLAAGVLGVHQASRSPGLRAPRAAPCAACSSRRCPCSAVHGPGDHSQTRLVNSSFLWRYCDATQRKQPPANKGRALCCLIVLGHFLKNTNGFSNQYRLRSPPAQLHRRAESTDEDEGSCVVCLAAPATVALVHGSTGHRCCCPDCAQQLRAAKQACPMCRQPFDQILQVF